MRETNREQWLNGLRAQLDAQERRVREEKREDDLHHQEMLRQQQAAQLRADQEDKQRLSKKATYATELIAQRNREARSKKLNAPGTFDEKREFELKTAAESQLLREENERAVRRLNQIRNAPSSIVNNVKNVKI